ncbi:MAG TPA: hypothetical protein VGM88_29260 [Kofleriaceae bacterium]|jgi:hypothetical protein
MKHALVLVLAIAGCGYNHRLVGTPAAVTFADGCRGETRASFDAHPAIELMCVPPQPHNYQSNELRAITESGEPERMAAAVVQCAAYACSDRGYPLADTHFLWMAWVADSLTPEVVARSLEKAHVRADVARAFPARYAAARAIVLARIDVHFREVVLAPMAKARAAMRDDNATLAMWHDKADALVERADRAVVAKGALAKPLADALDLRRDYVDACRKVRGSLQACLADETGTQLSDLVLRLAVDDPTREKAELAIATLDDRRSTVSVAAAALDESLGREYARRKEYDELKARRVSAKALAARFPEPPLAIEPRWSVAEHWGWPSDQRRDAEAKSPQSFQVEVVDTQVRAVRHVGANGLVDFPRVYSHESEQDGCYETGRVSRINSDGTLEYEERCTGAVRDVSKEETPKSLTIPWREAAGLHAKEWVRVAIDRKTRTGHLLYAGAAQYGGELQIGEWRVAARTKVATTERP